MIMNAPVIDRVGTGKKITQLRTEAGLTVRDLQEIFGFGTPQAIYKWQQGTAMPTLDNLILLATVLNAQLDDIIVIQTNNRMQVIA